jgi:hypothetical protein
MTRRPRRVRIPVRARCRHCGRSYALTQTGRVRRHARHLGVGSRLSRPCPGSGEPV